MSDLIYQGGSVKTIGKGEIGGWLCVFSGPSDPDLDGEYFDIETDFGLLGDGDKRFGFLEHTMGDLGHTKIGVGELRIRPQGVWLEAKLNVKDARIAKVFDSVRAGGMYLSSGSAGHLVRRQKMGNANKILSWPIVEWSVTSRPAERRAVIVSAKSLQQEELNREFLRLRSQWLRKQAGYPTTSEALRLRSQSLRLRYQHLTRALLEKAR